MKIGFIQGRLLESEKKSAIQFFPSRNWKKEIIIAKNNKFHLMEWTVNLENINKNPIYNSKLLNHLIKFKKTNKININSVTCDFFMQKPFFKLKKKEKFLNLEILKKVIVNGQKIGIRQFVIPLVDNSSITTSQQEQELVFEFNKNIFLNLLNKNTKILFEIDYPPKNVLKFIKRFNPNKFGINYDTGNSASLGYSINDEKIYFRHVKNVHIKDKLKNGQSVRLGYGDWDYFSFFNFLKKIKYKHNLILQTARSKNGNHVEEINYSRKFVLNLL